MTDTRKLLEPMLTIADVARALCISVRSVRRLIGSGELPYVRLTERRRGVLESDIAAFVAARRVVKPMAAATLADAVYSAACTRRQREVTRSPSKRTT